MFGRSSSGRSPSIASGKPVSPSTQQIRMSRTPRCLRSLRALHPELRALGLLKPHAQHVPVAVERDAEREIQRAALHRAALAELDDHAVQKHDRVDVLQRPLGPLAHVVHDRVGHARDQVAADLHAVDLLQVHLDVARRQATAVERQDLLVKPDEPPLALSDDLWLKAPIPIPGRIDAYLPVLADQRFRTRAVARVPGPARRLAVRLVAHMLGQLDLHRPLHQPLGQHRPTARRARRSPPR